MSHEVSGALAFGVSRISPQMMAAVMDQSKYGKARVGGQARVPLPRRRQSWRRLDLQRHVNEELDRLLAIAGLYSRAIKCSRWQK